MELEGRTKEQIAFACEMQFEAFHMSIRPLSDAWDYES